MGPRGEQAGAAARPIRPFLPRNFRISLPSSYSSSSSIVTIMMMSIILVAFVPPENWCASGAQDNHVQIALTALLRFKSSLTNVGTALADWNPSTPPCNPRGAAGNWYGVLCFNGYVLGLQLENMNLGGQIDVDSLVPLRFLRTLSFMNNNFVGPMPDWRKLGALKSLYLSKNHFSGQIPADAFKGMASLKKVHLANNDFTGEIPASLAGSPKLIELRLENNQFTGSIPPAFASTSLKRLNVSNNQLEGPIPEPLLKMDPSSFSGNKGLCVGATCNPPIPPPDMEPNLGPPPAVVAPGGGHKNNKHSSSSSKTIIAVVVCVVIVSLLIVALILIYRRSRKSPSPQLGREVMMSPNSMSNDDIMKNNNIAEEASIDHHVVMSGTIMKSKKDQEQQQQQPGKLSFVRDDRQKFDLQDLMRASAEVLGSGNFGASYKAVLVDGEALVVKRFKQMNNVAKEDFHEHMRRLGRLKHPNLLALVAYLYRKEEKLLVFDYVHNGSLATHLHGKHSNEQLGLRWETRLKIIKGVAEGLSYLHSELPSLTVPHGHLKSSNVLLDGQYNPLLMDYTLVPVVNPAQVQEVLVAYKSPEYAQLGRTTNKTDVWCLGILILETLTGKFVGKYLAQGSGPYGPDLSGWINTIVQEAGADTAQVFDKEMSDDITSESRPQMERLLEIGIACCQEDVDQRFELEDVVREIQLL